MANLFENLSVGAQNEVFTELLSHPRVRIERIVSNGQTTPADAPLDQDHDEWVLLLRGSATLWVDQEGERDLGPGDYLLIPAHRLHRVTRTAEDEPTLGSLSISIGRNVIINALKNDAFIVQGVWYARVGLEGRPRAK